MADESNEANDEGPLVDALITQAPAGWHQADAVFAVTATSEVGHVVYSVGAHTVSMRPTDGMFTIVRRQRSVAARSGVRPWWRILVVLTSSGEIDLRYDYGDYPFPSGQLFGPQVYRADLDAHPRERVPIWMAAYIGHGGRQLRSPQQAAAQARADRSSQVWATLAIDEFPPFPAMWARWATIAAAFVAVGSDQGPRMLPWTGLFESDTLSGATLHALPAGRAVLSGGVWNAPSLDAVYTDGAPMPNLYAGAPDWVTDQALNARASSGLLSFCYWWESGRWYRGQSPSGADCAAAVPGMWTRDTVIAIAAGLVPDLGDEPRAAIASLVSAAEAGTVTRATLLEVFGDTERFDVDGALYQYSSAGLVPPIPERMSAAEAISRVRDYVIGWRLDTTGYPLSQLVAERFSVGWMVFVPVPEGHIAIGRAIFYVGDDGVLEHSSSSIAPEVYLAEFEDRFAERHGSVR
ncbi:hypothetical protein AB0C34_00825 [Nocardia sp. NPDC049220]|uniref:hypothetical protein n=1 Tax=Nocardia sp. NPDC049220 TaxID=3155273 RepID=UPI0033CADC25